MERAQYYPAVAVPTALRCAAAFSLLLALPLLGFSPASAQRPNIIYIMTDDMGYGDLSGYGRKQYQTPHLDKLAAQGTKFVNAYAAGPVCTPTRAALMTGRYPARTPVGLLEPLTQTTRDSAFGLTAAFPSVATLLRARGYETALIGKWHLGFLPQHSPGQNGFDYFFGIHSGGADYVSHKSGPAGQRAHDLYENDVPVYPEGYLTELFTQRAVRFIQQPHRTPFFLTLTFTAPHWPWQGPTDAPYADSVEFTTGGSAATYAAMMKSLDDGIGTLLQALDEAHLSNQTLVIFTNDNGGEKYSDNGGLTKAKGALWEGGIRVPALVRWPGKIPAGTTTQQVAVTMDWTATILAAAGAKPDNRFPVDGIDLLPVITGPKPIIPRTLYWRTFQRGKQQALRKGEWKYVQDEQGEHLFNLGADPEEKDDLKGTHPARLTALKRQYAAWERTVLPPIPLQTGGRK